MPDERPAALPIFPLANVVLFPGVQVPLYIFEPRYRQMTAAALAGDQRIGMVAVRPGPTGMEGDPEVFAIGCTGEIVRSKPHEDGTYHIVLRGTSRFRIIDEVSSKDERLYRIANVETLYDSHVAEAQDPVARKREEILALMRLLVPDRADRFSTVLFENLDDVTFVNAFCQSVDFPVLEKQQLLEANTVRERVEGLAKLMRFRLAERVVPTSGGSDSVH